ncbi:hypothetical protein RsTz2092_00480 [Deferribacterales bacterium RsTz2092]|nr:hypothetical protein AGMMS49941_01230 [Deferribacterales bacterium]
MPNADNKKETERSALHATIWRIANDTREAVDITQLNARIAEIVTRENVLRTEIEGGGNS